MHETRVQSLGQEDPLEEGMATHPLQYSCLGNSMDRGAWWATAHGVTEELDRTLRLKNNKEFIREFPGHPSG